MGVSELGHEFHDILQSGASYGEYVSHAAARSPSLSALSTFLGNKTLQPSSASMVLSMQVDLRGQAGDYRVTGLEDVMAQVEDLQYQARKGFGGGLLIAVEDPGPIELEALGEALDVDPFFFAGHLAMTFQHIERNPNPPLLSLLPSKLASAEHININFQTVLDLGDEDDTVMCPRPYKVTIAGNNMRQLRILPPLSRRCIGLVRSCASVLRKDIGNGAWICMLTPVYDHDKKKRRENKRERLIGFIGLVMTDPAFKVANGASRGCSENPMLRRGISAEDVARQPTYSSFRKSSDRSFRLRSGSLAENLFSVWRDVQMPLDPVNGIPGILDLAYYPIRMALTEWKLYVQLMSRYVKFFEYSFETVMALPDRFERQDLVELNRWRRRGGQSLHKIRMTRNFVEYWRGRACGSSATAQQQREDWGLLLLDLKHIEMQIEKK